jgi:hypothetical protein
VRQLRTRQFALFSHALFGGWRFHAPKVAARSQVALS